MDTSNEKGVAHFPVHHGLLHVSLGAMRREYIPLIMQGANDPEVMRGVLLRPPITLESEYAWYDKTPGNELFAILLHEHDATGAVTGYRYIGHTGLHNVS